MLVFLDLCSRITALIDLRRNASGPVPAYLLLPSQAKVKNLRRHPHHLKVPEYLYPYTTGAAVPRYLWAYTTHVPRYETVQTIRPFTTFAPRYESFLTNRPYTTFAPIYEPYTTLPPRLPPPPARRPFPPPPRTLRPRPLLPPSPQPVFTTRAPFPSNGKSSLF